MCVHSFNSGGGGERVLWVAIRAMRARFPAAKFVVYTGDLDAAPDQIVSRIRTRFNVAGVGEDDVAFVYLHRRRFVEAEMYPAFTLLGQSVGSIWLGLEALDHGAPDVYIDTMGYAFTLPLFKYLGLSKTGCYVHYPTITTEMLDKVRTRRPGHNNRRAITNSPLATAVKLVYYRVRNITYNKN
jgi:alpha-1,2-mannosyltransferase